MKYRFDIVELRLYLKIEICQSFRVERRILISNSGSDITNIFNV